MWAIRMRWEIAQRLDRVQPPLWGTRRLEQEPVRRTGPYGRLYDSHIGKNGPHRDCVQLPSCDDVDALSRELGIAMTQNRTNDEKARDDAFRTRSGSHVARYIATNGEEGYDDNSHKAPTLLLTTTGRRSGKPHTAPLYFAEDNGWYIVIASKGGSDRDPQWYLNLVAHPEVGVQIRDKTFQATARTADAEEKERLWSIMGDTYPFYNDYRQVTDRDIPLIVLEPVSTQVNTQ